MKKISFKNTVFVRSVAEESASPDFKNSRGQLLPEIAVLGRSNVGKSSLLNMLFQSKDLVKVAKTPGKTRTINFFMTDEKIIFTDLPGYGFAKASKDYKKMWAKQIDSYIKNRQNLKLFLLLLDIRHLPSVEDMQMYRYLMLQKLPFLILFTKVDKLSKAAVEAQTDKILQFLQAGNCDYVHTSSASGLGRDALEHIILEQVL